MPVKQKWESDLGCTYDDIDWHNMLDCSQTVLISTKHRQMQFNIFNRTYYTPHRLHKIYNNDSPNCQRCKVSDGDLLHMLWTCPCLEEFWKYIVTTTSEIVGSEIIPDPRIWILGDIQGLSLTQHKKYFILLAGTAGKKCILQNWKAENSPSQRHWLNELTSYCTPEKILYNVRRNPATFEKIWGPFISLLPSLRPCN